MTQPSADNPSTPAAPTALEHNQDLGHMLCWGCGYSLRMRRLDESCPECGLPIRITLERQWLPLDQPQLGERTVSAMRCLAGSLLITALGVPLTTFCGFNSVNGEGVFGLLWFAVVIEYALWMAACTNLGRAFGSRLLVATGIALAVTACCTVTVMCVAIYGTADSDRFLIALVSGVAATQFFRLVSIARLWPIIFGCMRQFRLMGNRKALAAAGVAGILTTVALGLSHLLMLPLFAIDRPGQLGEQVVAVGVIAAIGCYITAFWTAITLFANANALSRHHTQQHEHMRADPTVSKASS
ncbi:MAG: hypothetical protein AAGF84_10035 [Planctomycetota bacterium]